MYIIYQIYTIYICIYIYTVYDYIILHIYIYISDIIENEETMLTDADCLLQRHRVFGFDELEQGMMRLEFAPKDLQAEG